MIFRNVKPVVMANDTEPSELTTAPESSNQVGSMLRSDDTRRRFLQALGATGAAGFAGCLGGGDDGGDSGSNGDGTPSNGDEGQTMVINATQRYGTIDPAKGTDYTQVMALVNYYDPLVFPDEGGAMQPHVADDWTVSEDGLTYTFELRDDITFHSGNDLTADDVQYSVERFLGIGEGYSSLVGTALSAENVTVDGDYSITMELSQPYSPFLDVLCLLFIVDQQYIEDNAEDEWGEELLNNNDAGSGPYTLGDFQRGSHISFERFDDYWLEFPDGSLPEVRAEIFDEDSTVQSSMRTGELHMSSQYQSYATYQSLSEEDDIEVREIPTATLLYFKMNTQRPPTDDVAVREAIATGFDYETARTEITPGASQAVGPVAPVFEAHNDEIPQPEYDPEAARQILQDAGYEEGELSIVFTHVQDVDRQEQNALLFQDNMEEIGIDVEINPQTWGRMTELATDPEQTGHVNHVFYGPVYPAVDAYLYNMYHSEAAETWMSMEHLEDDEVDNLIDQAREATDPEQMREYQRQAQARIAELYPDVFVFVQTKRHAFQEDLEGYTYRPAMSFDYWWRDYYWE